MFSKREDNNLRKSLSIIYIYAFVVHICFLIAFKMLGATRMQEINYFSPLLYAIAIFFNLKGKIIIGAIVAITEASVHGLASIIFIGWNTNFHLYVLLVYILVVFIYNLHIVVRVAIALAITITYMLLYVYGMNNAPVYDLPLTFVKIAGLINLVNTAVVFCVFAFTYSYFIRKSFFILEEGASELKLLNTQKDKFFSIFSHDLKNPISSIYNLLDLHIKRYDDIDEEKRKKQLRQVQVAIADTYKLVNNLLEWSKSQMDSIQLTPVIFNVENAVCDVASLMAHHAISKDITLEVSVPEKLTIYADEASFHSIIRNLMSNAIKFTPINGKVLINAERYGSKTKVNVIDNGIGISEDRLSDIFNLDNKDLVPGTANEKGSGLGLMLAKEFVEKNKGRIDIKSKAGEGSMFTVVLPASDQETI